MAQSIILVAADTVVETGTISFKFMGVASREIRVAILNLPEPTGFGRLHLAKDPIYSSNVPQWGEDVIPPLWLKIWSLFMICKDCRGGSQYPFIRQTFEDFPKERGLRQLLREMPNGILLIEKILFETIEEACEEENIDLKHHFHEGALETS